MKEKLQILDLFAGAGGLSNGFEQTNKFKVKIAVEINENARKTYQLNHPDVILHKDITQLRYKKQDGTLEDEFKDIDVIIGGPPCQGFSNANRQKNSLISSNNQLVKEYLRAIKEIMPTAFVMENVRTMDSEKHKFYLNKEYEKEIAELNIEAVDEHIKIGNRTHYSEDLKSFLIGAYESRLDLTPYVVNKDLLSKLNTLLRHLKKQSENMVIDFLLKNTNKSFFLKLISNSWYNSHGKYWNGIYLKNWNYVGESLKKILNNNSCDFMELTNKLEDILETEKIINKFSELIQNKIILYDINLSHNNFEVYIKSFNVFYYIKRRLKKLGYVFNEDKYIFNAAHYGVPQERKRLILMGVLEEELESKNIKIPSPLFMKSDFNTIYDAIIDLENLEPTTDVKKDRAINSEPCNFFNVSLLNKFLSNNNSVIYNHVRTESREIALKRFASLEEGQNFHDLDESLKTTYSDHSRTQNTIYKRLSYSKPSDTVLNVRKSMWIHPVKNRAISIREAARLQSFQDTYKFVGTKDSQYQQIGNAVPPLFARAIAESLLESIEEEVEEKLEKLLIPSNEAKETVMNYS